MLSAYLKHKIRVLLVGPPGCGKTARIHAAAESEGYRCITMRASLSERVDFSGCLVPNRARGVTEALPLELLHDLRTTEEQTLLFLDDLGQAPIDVQAALMRLFDGGELAEKVLIWGATNRPGDRAGVSALAEPLRSRFHLAFSIPTPESDESPSGGVALGTWKGEVEAWCNWALDEGFPPEIIAWHRSGSGRSLYAWKPHADPAVRMPDYRSWETVGRLWALGIRDLQGIGAAIGRPAAVEFLAFARISETLPTPDRIFMDPEGAPVPTETSALFLTAANLAAATTIRFAAPMIRYVGRMPRVYGALCARDAYRRLGPKLSGSREWQEWFLKNQELFST